jgi:hypothetical protein
MPNSWLANLDWTYSSDQISFWQVTVTYHTAFSRFASATTLALEILGYFVLDRSLQQLPRSFAQELFQIAFRFDFCSLLERGHINVHFWGASFLFGSSGEAAVGFFFY